MRIFLLGYMGCGKTTVAKKMAYKLGLEFIDLDKQIEHKCGKSISAIFEEDGEDVFRTLERESLNQFIAKNNFVMAVGGGTPCFFDNMKVINESGVSVYLQMSAKSLTMRLESAKSERPLIAEKSQKELLSFIRQHLSEREPFYLLAKYVTKGENLSVNRLTELLR